ncbi:hypothetical protein ACOSP7_003636 [Xanthoceras sorbifolium]
MRERRLILVALPSIIFFLLLFFYLHLNVHVKSSLVASSKNIVTTEKSHPPTTKFSLLIGILTSADNYDRRHFLRLLYGIQSSPISEIDIKFVFCRLTKTEQRILISLEMLRYNDIIILNCTENMDRGKTYTLKPLSLSLEPLSRVDLYYGFVIPCTSMNPYVDYMSGMGFVLSWDIVEWIGVSNIPPNDTLGPEDKLVGKWLKKGNKGKNRFNNKPAMYDYPGTKGKCSHELIPETVAVHRLKKWDQWLHVFLYFNVTKGLHLSL